MIKLFSFLDHSALHFLDRKIAIEKYDANFII